MKDGLGSVQSIAVFGGTSDIGLAIVERLARAGRLQRLVLVGRDAQALAVEQKRFSVVPEVEVVGGFDAARPDTHDDTVDAVFAGGDVDVAIFAFGLLGDQATAEADPEHALEIGAVNYAGVVSVGVRLADRIKQQGHGTIVVLSSVAAERARRSNFVYGSAKAGADAFALGLAEQVRPYGGHVLVVRPGFVRTRMTQGVKEAPFATEAAVVAEEVERGLRHGAAVVWAPGFLRYVMAVLRHLPRAVFCRLPQ
ncbi:MAG: decaprenylphospho-beta-D-erythro-pentofuranosid-2-ulose 2-reductase [Actinomycetota bacterium]|nr:decaprenylphospho-beta-D-erythro-pentofuranosid-2-ulose 2-reductase [Actinomycetota bacterium]